MLEIIIFASTSKICSCFTNLTRDKIRKFQKTTPDFQVHGGYAQQPDHLLEPSVVLEACGVVVGVWGSEAKQAGTIVQLVCGAVLLEPRHSVSHGLLEQVLNKGVPGGGRVGCD